MAIVAPVPTQPKPKRRLGWWEEDWAKTKRATLFQKVKQEVLAEDLPGSTARHPHGVPDAVEDAAYSDVINVNNGQRTIQGFQLRAEQTAREGEPLIRRYATVSNEGFPDVRLTGVPEIIPPVNDREAVAPGFGDLGPVEPFSDVKTLYR
jgi:hypothetical protein